MSNHEQRKGARSIKEIDPAVLKKLNRGEIEALTLPECLAVDAARLMKSVFPSVGKRQLDVLESLSDKGITRKMSAAARILLDAGGKRLLAQTIDHPSDTVRGWGAYMIGLMPDISLAERFEMVRPLADDLHFGVREWAWLGLRPKIAAEIKWALQLMQPWSGDNSAYIRRFASEATRPRGVWSEHIGELKQKPEMALKLLNAYQTEHDKYVQDSVANWLNDASKSRPNWVQDVCRQWLAKNQDNPNTERICFRAMRSICK